MKWKVFLSLTLIFLAYAQFTSVGVFAVSDVPPRFRTFDKVASDEARIKDGKIATKSGAIRQKIDEKRKALVLRYFNQMIKRFEAAIGRLKKISGRIERRIGKIKDNGGDTAAVEAQLSTAKAKLNEVEAALSLLKTSSSEILEADDPKTAFQTVRLKISGLRDSLQAVHKELVMVIAEIRGLRVGMTDNASKSAEIVPLPTVSVSVSPTGTQ